MKKMMNLKTKKSKVTKMIINLDINNASAYYDCDNGLIEFNIAGDEICWCCEDGEGAEQSVNDFKKIYEFGKNSILSDPRLSEDPKTALKAFLSHFNASISGNSKGISILTNFTMIDIESGDGVVTIADVNIDAD